MTRSGEQLDLLLIVRTPAGDRRAVSVRIAPDRPSGELVERLADHLGMAEPSLRLHVPGRRVAVSRSAEVGGLGLRMGDELWLLRAGDHQPPGPSRPASPWELVVVSGPHAGRRFPLRLGEQILGRGVKADLRLPDEAVSRSHLLLSVSAESVTLSPGGPKTCAYLDGRPVARGHGAAADEVYEVGHALVAVRAAEGVRPRPETMSSGRVQFNRPPAARRVEPALDFKLPAAPADSTRLRVPIGAVLTPLLVGAAIWLATRNVFGLLFALATPLMAVAPVLDDLLVGRWQRRRQALRYRNLLAESCSALERLRAREARAITEQAPDAPELEARARLVLPALWERRPDRPGFLRLRLGWGDLPSLARVEVPDGGRTDLREEAAATALKTAVLAAVPVTADLSDAGWLGLAGTPEAVDSAARWLIVQAAALHSPHELALAAFLSRRAAEDWQWLRWLPHVRQPALNAGAPLVAVAPEAQRRLALALQARPARGDPGHQSGQPTLVVLVHEDAAIGRAALAGLMQPDAPRGAVVWAGSSAHLLPEACRAVAEIGRAGTELRLTLLNTGTELVGIPDLVDVDFADRVARSLSGIEPVGTPAAANPLPGAVGVVECLDLRPGEVLEGAIRRWWSAEQGDLAAPVGVAAAGVLTVDLREQGPHALVGGTSGSGKSEFLRAWVTALAARHSPRRLNFLLVDFKGGTAFQDCARLPHVVGVVTDLSDHLLGRIQQSLLAELKRREAEMARFGHKEFVDFAWLQPDDASPVLVVVFDEFEQLLAEHPGFVSDVIAPIARLGRGLGVHLVLGTQKPQGSVPEAIRSNTNIRVALRMLSEVHSRDVIDSADAARIAPSARGRAYLRLSHESLQPFQVAYAGARSARECGEAAISDLRPDAASEECSPEAGARMLDNSGGPTDFERLTLAMVAVYAASGLTAPRRPWLPPLPEVLPLSDLPPPTGLSADWPQAALGLLDEPRRQSQRPLRHSLAGDGHLLVYGAARSGKSWLLRTFACSLAVCNPPTGVWLYGLDFSGGVLRPLEALPHVGGVAGADEPERVAQLLRMLTCQMARRHREVRPDRPAIVVLVDEYSTFRTVFERVDGGRYLDLLDALVRDGRPLGVHCVITTSQRRDLSGLLSASITRRVLLRPDRHDAEAMDVAPDLRPASALPPGRGFLDGRLELQVAVLADGAPASESAALCALGERLSRLHPGLHAPRITVLPDTVELAELTGAGAPLRAFVGLGGDEVTAVEVDLLSHGHLAVCGPRGSGRTTALSALAVSLARADALQQLVLLSPRRQSALRGAANWSRAAFGTEECRELALDLAQGLVEAARAVVVIVDDAELMMDSPADVALRALIRLGRDQPVRVVAAVEVRALRRYSEWLMELRESRHAILLNPDVSADGELFGAGPLPRPLRPWPPGRGFLIRPGQVVPLQVAT
ncbi:MAG TPA: FtsK/SpoIIIE domain-containing protein [Candidatus Dormibacteraeota bacterium]|nr:FtsK/SpoIIIE domain-containing protein [Candidatus Dormibacteraeota bacterium]